MTIKAIRGTRDILMPEVRYHQKVETMAGTVFERYGYSEIKLPVFEQTELFTRGIGEDTDIVHKEMYTFADRKGRSLTLRPEGTASVVRAVIEHGLARQGQITRLYYSGPMFRYERPQKGRYRQFYQVGVEAFGTSSPALDVEVIQLTINFLSSLGLKGLKVMMNSLGDREDQQVFAGKLRDYVSGKIDGYCADCKRRYETNPLRVLDCKVSGCVALNKDAPGIAEALSDGSRGHFEKVQEYLEILGIEYEINPHLVRGLDYYTQTIFEVVHDCLGSQNSICGGGRYDNLVSDFGGSPTAAAGMAVGVDRLVMVIQETEAAEEKNNAPSVYVIPMTEAELGEGLKLTSRLREMSLKVLMNYDGGSFKSQMKKAGKSGAEYAVILGPDELAKNEMTIKNFSTGEQRTCPLNSTRAELRI
jgi:histidyl-tRNA synthetase